MSKSRVTPIFARTTTESEAEYYKKNSAKLKTLRETEFDSQIFGEVVKFRVLVNNDNAKYIIGGKVSLGNGLKLLVSEITKPVFIWKYQPFIIEIEGFGFTTLKSDLHPLATKDLDVVDLDSTIILGDMVQHQKIKESNGYPKPEEIERKRDFKWMK